MIRFKTSICYTCAYLHFFSVNCRLSGQTLPVSTSFYKEVKKKKKNILSYPNMEFACSYYIISGAGSSGEVYRNCFVIPG